MSRWKRKRVLSKGAAGAKVWIVKGLRASGPSGSRSGRASKLRSWLSSWRQREAATAVLEQEEDERCFAGVLQRKGGRCLAAA